MNETYSGFNEKSDVAGAPGAGGKDLAPINPGIWEKIQKWLKGKDAKTVAAEMKNIASIINGLQGVNKTVSQSRLAQEILQQHQVLQQKMSPQQVSVGDTNVPTLNPQQANEVLGSIGLR